MTSDCVESEETVPQRDEMSDTSGEAPMGYFVERILGEHPGVIITVVGPDDLPSVARLHKHHVHVHGLVLWKTNDLMCLWAAFLHALNSVRG